MCLADTLLWTATLVVGVCRQKGWTPRVLTAEGMRQVFKRLGVGWRRAKHWSTSPDPDYTKVTSSGTG